MNSVYILNLKSIINSLDEFISPLLLNLTKDRGHLMIFTFHTIFPNLREIEKFIFLQQKITISFFEDFIKYMLNKNYIFIAPQEILNGLNQNLKYAMITFDDGYYNNTYSLPILKKYKIPAVFFISIENVLKHKSFWWDVLYREMKNYGYELFEIMKIADTFLNKKTSIVENFLKNQFGPDSFNPLSNIDRPFTPNELKDFSNNKYVHLGNHTTNHNILTNYSLNEVEKHISYAQKKIKNITNKEPIIIAYPNGKYSKDIIDIAKNYGIKLGLTAEYSKNPLPILPYNNSYFKLGRFLLDESRDMKKQCDIFRSDFSLMRIIQSLKKNI